jgi:hypothetical protein
MKIDKVEQVENGSKTRVTLLMTRDEGERVLAAFRSGELASIGVVEADVREKDATSTWATRTGQDTMDGSKRKTGP